MFEKDDQEISQIIERALEAVLSGEVTLDEFVAQHPEHAAAIRAELDMALLVNSYSEQVKPRPGFIPASRKRLLTRISQEASTRGAKRSLFGLIWPRRLVYQLSAALLVLIILLSGTGGMVGLSQSALPGDGLYPIKRTSEQVAYSFTFRDVDRVSVSAAYAERRLDEAEALIEKEDYEDIASTIQVFEQQVDQTVTLFENVSDSKAKEKITLADSIKKEFNTHAEVLDKLQSSAPEEVRGSLKHAETTAMLGAMSVEEETRNIVDPTATPQPTVTTTPTDLPEPTVTNTPPPPTATPVVEETQQEKTTEEEPTDDPSDGRITKTPRPTNENRPEKPTPKEPPEQKPPKPEPKPERTKNKSN